MFDFVVIQSSRKNAAGCPCWSLLMQPYIVLNRCGIPSRTMLIKLNAICINHLSIFSTIFVSDYLIDCKESMDDRETKKKLTN